MRNPNICRFVMHGIVFAGLLVTGIAGIIWGVDPLPPLVVVGAALAFGGAIFGSFTVRCPACRRPLPWRIFWTDYCPHCGEKIGW